MLKLKSIGRVFFAVLLSIVGVSLVNQGATKYALAADIPEYRLQVSPSQAELKEIQPGETYTGSFKVQNTGQKPYKFETEIAPYAVKSGSYESTFVEDSKYTLMKDWITIEGGEGEVQPGEQAEVKYTLKVPNDAPAGNQNAAITVTLLNENESSDSGIKTIQQVAFIMFSNIAGETRETAEIIDNKIPSFLFNPPVIATSTVKNTGNVYTAAKYILEISSFFGGKNVYTTPEEESLQVIFPETERYNEVSWDGAPQLGLFKVKQTITIFDETSTTEKLVFLCPIWFLVVIILFVAVAIFWIVSRLLKRKQA